MTGIKWIQQSVLGLGFVAFFTIDICALRIDRAIVSSDSNPTYLEFWPIIARAWQQLFNIRPTLIFIGETDKALDKTCGDVVLFQPIKGIETSYQSQVVRVLAPALFPEDNCIISDIDMIPINHEYFVESLREIADDKFVVFRNGTYGPNEAAYPLCYHAAKGKIFAEVFGINSLQNIRDKMAEWRTFGLGWNTDEVMLFRCISQWRMHNTEKCVLLGRTAIMRLDRLDFNETTNFWNYNRPLAQKRTYVDCHLVRPRNKYARHIDELTKLLGIAED